MPGDSVARVFVSHSSEDADIASKVVGELEKRGVSCWVAPRDVPAGASYPVAIMEAAHSACALVLILSRHASSSKHVPREVERMDNLGKPLFSLQIDDAPLSRELEYFTAIRQRVHMIGSVNSEVMDMLAAQLKQVADGSAADGMSQAQPPSVRVPAPKALGWVKGLVLSVAALLITLVTFYGLKRTFDRDRVPNRGGPVEGHESVNSEKGLLKYHAVVIGISDYEDGGIAESRGWRDLPSARGDADELAKVLEDTYGFTVTRLFDRHASRSAILAAIDALATAGPNTAALICFAGHGTYEGSRKEGYWIPADARKAIDGRPAREDWIWNSTIQKIVGASDARHFLLIADACYAGTLFRHDELANAVSGPTNRIGGGLADASRYLIASGGVEEVPDGGNARSAFMQAVLDVLKARHKEPVTAQALGHAVRDRLRRDMGRDIAIGPLVLSSPAGGQFVFAEKGGLKGDMLQALSSGSQARPAATPDRKIDVDEMLASVLALNRVGATNAALRLLASVSANKSADQGMASAVAAYIDRERRVQAGTELRSLIESLKKLRERQPQAQRAAGSTAPRILACIGPSAPPGASPDVESRVLLCRLVLQSQVKSTGRAVVVERECLEQILKEMQLGDTDLSDARTRLALGKILQAGVLLFGEYLPEEAGDTLILRLVETETTQLLDSVTGVLNPQAPATSCQAIGKQLADAMIRACPVRAGIVKRDDRVIQMAAGRLHGVAPNAAFDLFEMRSDGSRTDAKPFARAVVQNVDEETSELALPDGQPWGNRQAGSVRAEEVMPPPPQ